MNHQPDPTSRPTEARYLVTTEQRVWLGADGQPHGAVALSAVSGLEEMGAVTVLARVRRKPPGSAGAPLFAGHVDLRPVGGGSSAFFRWRSAARYLAAVARDLRRGAVLVAHTPGVVAAVPLALAMLLRRRFAVVVVGDPAESLAPDVVPGLAGRLARVVLVSLQRQACRRAAVARYVTEAALQRAYPPGTDTHEYALSDVVLEDADAPHRAPEPGKSFRLVTVGSLERPYKGIGDLLAATALVRADGHPFEVLVVGDGVLRKQYQREAASSDLPVTFYGQVAPQVVREQLRKSDAFVLASWTEGQPRALYEAMSCGLPVVATAVGGVPDVVPPISLVPPRNPAALADALERLMADPGTYEFLAAHSTRTAVRLTSAASRERHADFLRDLAGPALEVRSREPVQRAVLHILGTMSVGGAEMRTVELMGALVSTGLRAHYVTLSGNRGTLAPEIERMGGEVHPIPLSALLPFRLLRLLGCVRPIAVDSHVATFSGVVLLLARLRGVPVRIARLHSTGDDHGQALRRRVQRRILRELIDRNATHVLGVSPAALAEGYRPDWQDDPRCSVLPTGLDVERLWQFSDFDLRQALSIPADHVICLHVGRASPEKNRARIPRLMAAMRARGIPAWGVLVGPASAADESEVLRVARECGVERWIAVLDERRDVGRLMRDADFVLLTSFREGLPGTVLEAAAVGTPVLSSSVPGAVWISDLVPNVRCLPLSADDGEWAEEARRLLAVPRTAEAAARAAFEASPFAMSRAVAANLALYEPSGTVKELLAAGGTTPPAGSAGAGPAGGGPVPRIGPGAWLSSPPLRRTWQGPLPWHRIDFLNCDDAERFHSPALWRPR